MFFAKKIIFVLCCLICFQTAKAADWKIQESGTFAWLRDVYFLNANKGFIAGSSGTLLLTEDGGKSWKPQKTFTEDTIKQVYFSDENTGWLFCQKNIYNRGADAPSYLLKTIDGGASWEKTNLTSGRERIAKIFSNKNGLMMAVGESGVLFVLQDDGKSWKKTALATQYLLLDGGFTDEFRAVIVGAGGSVFFTEDAGASWNKAFVSGDVKTKFNRVFFVNKNSGWAVGTQGKIYQTFNGGKSWRAQTSGVAADLTDVFFLNTAEGWAVGDGGAILHTTTAGNIWTAINQSVNRKIERIFFVGGKGFAVGFGGTILSLDRAETNDDLPAKPQSVKKSK